jgi:hypothetical protein
MGIYHVKCRGQVDETYAIEADTEAEAMGRWADGTLVISEAWDVGPVSAELVED